MRLFLLGIGRYGAGIESGILHRMDIPLIGSILRDRISRRGIRGMTVQPDHLKFDGRNLFRPFSSIKSEHHRLKNCSKHISRSATFTLIHQKYGCDLETQEPFSQPELKKAVLEIFEMDSEVQNAAMSEYSSFNPIISSTWNSIRTHMARARDGMTQPSPCDGIMIITSLESTETGLINPLTSHMRSEAGAFPVFVLGVLAKGGAERVVRQKDSMGGRRMLSSTISMYELLTKSNGQGVDCLILVDDLILAQKSGEDWASAADFISRSMRPLLAARGYPGERGERTDLTGDIHEKLRFPPILIPCYSQRRSSEEGLVKAALNDGRLFGCNPRLADRAFIFARGFVDCNSIRQATGDETGLADDQICMWRKLGDDSGSELLILLRNPYGSAGAYSMPGTLEGRIYREVMGAINYIEESRDEILYAGPSRRMNAALEDYFYGRGGLKDRLCEALMRIEQGRRPFFLHELEVFSPRRWREQAVVPMAHTVSMMHMASAAPLLSRDEDDRISTMIREEALKILQERGIKIRSGRQARTRSECHDGTIL